MTDSFTESLDFVLRWEGGYSNKPQDHGGPTMKGVTQKEYDDWRNAHRLALQSVKLISDDELTTIYKNEYWLAAACDRLSPKLDLVQFDTCVNMGKNRAIKILQQAVGATCDGSFGPATQQACDNSNAANAAAQYCLIREGLYRGFAQRPGQAIFLEGWLKRLNDLRVEAGVTQQRGPHGPADFGGAPYIETIPDLAPDEPLEDWR
jgi:lysozyme family protein